jgi:hypothetical protein
VTPHVPDTRGVLELLGLLLLAWLIVATLIVPAIKELRHVLRRLRLARDLESARTSTTHRDVGRPRVRLRLARLPRRANGHPPVDLSAMHELSPPDGRLDVARAARIDRVVGVTLRGRHKE